MAPGPIVIVGGHFSKSRDYRGLARVLGEITGSETHVVEITPSDWLLGRLRGYHRLLSRIQSTVERALSGGPSEKAVLVAHSAGGVAARVYLGGEEAYRGRRYSGHRRVSHLVTLASPHRVVDRAALSPITEANRLFPETPHAATGLRYVSVAGNAVDGADPESPLVARKRYGFFGGEERVPGDGVIPVESTRLAGAESVVVDGLYHDHHRGRWYGSDRETVERWWPADLRNGGPALTPSL